MGTTSALHELVSGLHVENLLLSTVMNLIGARDKPLGRLRPMFYEQSHQIERLIDHLQGVVPLRSRGRYEDLQRFERRLYMDMERLDERFGGELPLDSLVQTIMQLRDLVRDPRYHQRRESRFYDRIEMMLKQIADLDPGPDRGRRFRSRSDKAIRDSLP